VSDSPAVRVVVEAIKSATLCCNAAIDAADDDDADDDDDSADETLDDNESTVASKLVTRLASGLLRFLCFVIATVRNIKLDRLSRLVYTKRKLYTWKCLPETNILAYLS
jgi:hypothetical protein